MAEITITPESKNSLSISNESKQTSSGTFGSFPGRTFADGGTFGEPALYLSKESKNSLSIGNESKSSISTSNENKNTLSIANENKI